MVCRTESNSVGKTGNAMKVLLSTILRCEINTMAACRWQPNPKKRKMLDKEGLREEENEKHTPVCQIASPVLITVTNCVPCDYIGDHGTLLVTDLEKREVTAPNVICGQRCFLLRADSSTVSLCLLKL